MIKKARLGMHVLLETNDEKKRANILCGKDSNRFSVEKYYDGLVLWYWPLGEAYTQEQYDNGLKIVAYIRGEGDFSEL